MEAKQPIQKPALEEAENELWHIVRMHASDISLTFEFTPHYGTVYYSCRMIVCGREFISGGRNLWKRYRDFTKTLKQIYGENLYEYDKKPLHL